MNLLTTLREELETQLEKMGETLLREVEYEEVTNKISVFIGVRRTGKTVFLFQRIRMLLNQGINSSQILYINFEDERLLAPDHSILVDLVDAFYSLYPENHDRHCYLFFDEIQNVPGWPIVVRRFLDSKKASIYLTGSSAKLLSKEIATSLRGRSIATEIWPFSFHEFLLTGGISFSHPMGKKSFDKIAAELRHYLQWGGFPEVIFVSMMMQHRILQDYVNLVVMRDVIERYQITNVTLIRYLIKSLLKNIGSPFSVNKFFNDIKSQGIALSKNTLYDYLNYIEDAFLLFMVPLYDESIRKVATHPKKVYTIDPGLINAYALSVSSNFGHLFENMIYLDLRRKNHEIFYYVTEGGYEIDFFSCDKLGNRYLWQVVWDISDPKTMQREQRALALAEKELAIKGMLITPEIYLDKFLKMQD